ncbi:DUF86 domain-containing protein [Dietzia cercidiphylli]|uniref:Uncharacterized protein n=2 Tax=Dietzia cercidiphylli TaxID=498199 RepID=A0ABN2J619_9ACTN|nr:DUF86 domain-containing protein [Dietzia cercidiphylli]MBB1049982.1 DUF86 domain-containing protein [Dietzia sp. CW19]
MKSPIPYLDMAVAAATRAAGYAPASEVEFLASPMAQDAICMRLQEVGENLSKSRRHCPDFYSAHQSEGWHRLIGLRNVISLGYAEVDMRVVWTIMRCASGSPSRGAEGSVGHVVTPGRRNAPHAVVPRPGQD